MSFILCNVSRSIPAYLHKQIHYVKNERTIGMNMQMKSSNKVARIRLIK